MHTFTSRKLARKYLADKGMVLNRTSSFSDQDREYWWFPNQPNALLDHSATITRHGKKFYVSDFSDKK